MMYAPAPVAADLMTDSDCHYCYSQHQLLSLVKDQDPGRYPKMDLLLLIPH
jgi:hypothetical protein